MLIKCFTTIVSLLIVIVYVTRFARSGGLCRFFVEWLLKYHQTILPTYYST